jgi:hypothetical protein
MLTVRTIHLAEGRVESATYELPPATGNPEVAVAQWAKILGDRPPSFREKLPFLPQVELEWSVGPGGVVLASMHNAEAPCSMAIVLPGREREADDLMFVAWRRTVLVPLMGEAEAAAVEAPERPLLLTVLCPAAGKDVSALRLTTAALASAYLQSAGIIPAAAG